MKRKSASTLTLLFLSPGIAELLSSSAPPLEFFNPIGFLMLLALYGFGCILIREYRIRNDLDSSSILLLGMAYGIVEEGIAVKSFFNPAWQDIGILGEYGRFIGVNWVWSIGLTLYHAIISIAIPIAITELMYSDIAGERWIESRRRLNIILTMFLLDIFFINLALTGDYQPNILHYLFSIFVVYLLIKYSRRVRIKPLAISPGSKRSWLTGLIWMVLFYIIFFGFPNMNVPIVLEFLISLIFFYLGLRIFANLWNESLPVKTRMAFALGPPSLFILLSPIFEFSMERSDNPAGMTLVGIAFTFIFLYIYLKKVKEKRFESA